MSIDDSSSILAGLMSTSLEHHRDAHPALPGLISVMIGVHNGRPYLAEAIDSVLTQNYSPFELIVVDDGSDDDSGEVARSYPEVRYVFQENRGRGPARNRAVEEARGEFFAFLDADDRFTPGKLRLQHSVLDADRTLDAVFGHAVEFFSPELDEEICASLRPPKPDPAPWTSPNLMLIRRKAFARVGLFSSTLRIGETVDWFARATEAELRYVILPEIVLERRLHTQNSGVRDPEARTHYVQAIRAAVERRRAAAAPGEH